MEIEITRPDDMHLHLRDGEALKAVVGFTARQFGRAIIMPNLKPPVVTTADAKAYHQRIMDALPEGHTFEPLMTLYLRDNTSPDEIQLAADSGFIKACKLYPLGATTNSDLGVSNIRAIDDVLAAMAACGMPLLLHGEVTSADVDIFHREAVFVQTILPQLIYRHPFLKIVLEHISTKTAVDFVRTAPVNVAATITAHHLLDNRNAIFKGGIRPHYYCLPILKTERDRLALLDAATSGNPKFFLGTDSAPHSVGAKESACGCAGAFTAYDALGLYAQAFDEAGQIGRLSDFASRFGADFYELPHNTDRIKIVKSPHKVPASYPFGEGQIVPYRADEEVLWRFEESQYTL